MAPVAAGAPKKRNPGRRWTRTEA